jgi:G:T-mismatch repair DNA endonuclease (very short patch repair protein)
MAANKARDQWVNRTLRKKGWRVVRIWEHDLAKQGEICIRRIQAALGTSIAPRGGTRPTGSVVGRVSPRGGP